MTVAVGPPSGATLHVNSVSGSDSNSGLNSAAPLATLGAAMAKLAGMGGGTVKVTAPSGTPLTENVAYTGSVPITIESATSGTKWYMDANGGSYCLWVHSGTGAVTVTDGDFTDGSAAAVLLGRSTAPTGTGTLTLTDCDVHGAALNGVGTQGVWTALALTRVDSSDNTNDGVSVHCTAGTPTATLVDCTGSGNGDEFASPHDTCTMIVSGGSSTNNAHGALAAAGSAVLTVSNFTSTADYQGTRQNGEGAITYIDATTSGSLTNVTVTNSPEAPGVIIKSGASVSRTNLTSTGNNGADDYAA